jgi:hypothetical protein
MRGSHLHQVLGLGMGVGVGGGVRGGNCAEASVEAAAILTVQLASSCRGREDVFAWEALVAVGN